MKDDDWGCVPASDLFFTAGKTQSLQYLVDQVRKGAVHPTPVANPGLPFCSPDGAPVRRTANGRPIAKKILKKKTATSGSRVPNLKHVTFEVESFVNSCIAPGEDRQQANERMAVRLGAKPAKSKPLNYKLLKVERESIKKGVEESGVDRFEIFRRLLPKRGMKISKKKL